MIVNEKTMQGLQWGKEIENDDVYLSKYLQRFTIKTDINNKIV